MHETSAMPGDPSPVPLKIVVGGGLGAGKTTFVGAVSEITPLSTEERMTTFGEPVDSLDGLRADKDETTVAFDFGRRTFRGGPLPLELFLFGTPGQNRFVSLWEDICRGAVGAVVIIDTARLAESFTAVSFFEATGLPFLIALNRFDGTHHYPASEVRDALGLAPDVPVISCDARDADQVASVLITLAEHALPRFPSPTAPLPALDAR
ncbi:GTP-binding protein [Streptomyces sp. NPDC004673]